MELYSRNIIPPINNMTVNECDKLIRITNYLKWLWYI